MKDAIGKFMKIALSKMKDLVIKLLDPAELFDRENILEDFNLDYAGREALREKLNTYKREFILENIKFFCLAICPGIPSSARAFGSQMLEFKKSIEEDINFKRLEVALKADIELLNNKTDEQTKIIMDEIEFLRNSIKPKFLNVNAKKAETPKKTWKQATEDMIAMRKATNALKRTKSAEERAKAVAKVKRDFEARAEEVLKDTSYDNIEMDTQSDKEPPATPSLSPTEELAKLLEEGTSKPPQSSTEAEDKEKVRIDKLGKQDPSTLRIGPPAKGSFRKSLKTKNKRSKDYKSKKSKKPKKSKKSKKPKKPKRTRRK